MESAGQDVEKFESGLGSMAEVILEEAKSEQLLAGKVLEWKSCVSFRDTEMQVFELC